MTNPDSSRSIPERRIADFVLPWQNSKAFPRICTLGLRAAIVTDPAIAKKRDDIEFQQLVDHEDYDAVSPGPRPEGSDPRGDAQICGIGSCTLRIFETTEGTEIQTGTCLAETYCLKERFEATDKAPSIEEGSRLYREIMATCDSFATKYSAGDFCPNLACGLTAGVSIDGVSDIHGMCARETA